MDIYRKLYEIGAIKFGDFKLKSNISSPIYIDLRICISYPEILKEIAKMIQKKVLSITYDYVLGVPYSGIFFACSFAYLTDSKQLLIRKEKKEYGSKKLLEGIFKKGEKCLVIEDVTTTGSSLLNTIESLRNEGIQVKNAIVIFNREKNIKSFFLNVDCHLHSLLDIFEMLDYLKTNNLIDESIYQDSLKFINGAN